LINTVGLKKIDKLVWADGMQMPFVNTKKLMAVDALSTYPNHNLHVDIYTDASDYQLGACILQHGCPVAYFTKKLTGAQMNYTTMENKSLFIVAYFQEIRSMSFGANKRIYTYHNCFTFDTLNTQRVLRRRSYVEVYSPMSHYIEGKKNILAGNLSRLHRFPTPEIEKQVDP